MIKRKKDDVFFIVSGIGNKKSRANFYDKKGDKIPKEELEIRYRNSNTGRFVKEQYINGARKVVPCVTPRRETSGQTYSENSAFYRSCKTGRFISETSHKEHPRVKKDGGVPPQTPVFFGRNKRK